MAKIQFENGKTVEFDGNPTPDDVEHVAQQLGISGQPTPAPQTLNPAMQGGAMSPANIQAQQQLKIAQNQSNSIDPEVGAVQGAYNMTWPVSALMKSAMGNGGVAVPQATTAGGKLLSDFGMMANPLTGEAIGLAGKTIAGIPKAAGKLAGRIDDWMVKLPTKAFRYGKDPLNVMKDEAVTGNSITDLAKNYEDRLNLRTQQLKDAVANNPAQLNLAPGVQKLLTSLRDSTDSALVGRGSLNPTIQEIQKNISTDYPDLNKLSLSRAVDLKRKLADEFPFSLNGTAAQNSLAKAAHQLHHQINDLIDTNAPNVGELNEKVSSLIDISQSAKNRMAIEARQNPLGLVGSLMGLGGAEAGLLHGGLGGAMEGGAAGLTTALAVKAATSPASLSRVAWALSKLSMRDKLNLFQKAPFLRNYDPTVGSGSPNHISATRG